MIAACPMGSFIYLLMMPALWSQWLMGSKYRNKLRARYHLVEAPYQDVISHIFCAYCSLCQEYRELKIRGLDPSQGIYICDMYSTKIFSNFNIIFLHYTDLWEL